MNELKMVDAHQHFWDLERNYYPWLCDPPLIPFRYGDYSPIRHSYLPEDYRADSAGHDIVKTVHVEAEWNPADPLGETRWLQEIHDSYGIPNAVVAQAWLDRDDIEQVLAEQAQYAIVRGIRHKPRAAVSADEVEFGALGSMGDPEWRAGFALLSEHGFSFDLQTPYWHLHEAAELAALFPATQIILNHTGLPADRSEGGLRAWRAALQAVAAAPNVAIKISGLGLPDRSWRLEENRRIVLDTIDIFGADRCLFASNFPVDKIVASFDAIFSGFKEIVRDFSEANRKKLFHDNAVRIYRLSEQS